MSPNGFIAEIAERTVVVTWPDNDRGGATSPPDGWQDKAWEQPTLHEIDEGSVTGCSVLRWRDDPRPDAELIAVSLALVTGQATAPPVSGVVDRATLRDRIAAAIWERQNPGRRWADCEYRWRADAEEDADAVLAVLPEAVDPAAVLLWAADQIDAETRQAKADEVLEPDKFRPCRDASAQLRRLAAEQPTNTETPEADADTVANRAAQVITTMGAEIRALTQERNRYRNAWHNARARAADAEDNVRFTEEERPAVVEQPDTQTREAR